MMDEPDDTLGAVTYFSSDEDGSPDVGMSIGLGHGRHLWIGEVSRDLYRENGPLAAALGSDFGWWIVLYGGPAPMILGKMTDAETAWIFVARLQSVLVQPPQVTRRPPWPLAVLLWSALGGGIGALLYPLLLSLVRGLL